MSDLNTAIRTRLDRQLTQVIDPVPESVSDIADEWRNALFADGADLTGEEQ